MSTFRVDKKTRTLTQTKYAPDGTFICKSITKPPEHIIWRDEAGDQLSPEQVSTALERLREKAIHLESLKAEPAQ